MSQDGPVVVVGGGVIGAACAYYLRRAGLTVTVVDRGAFGAGCSHGNCGFVSPSHVLPLAGPGMLGVALRSLLDGASPLRVKPRVDPGLWRWFWHFSRRCNARDLLESARGIHPLLRSARGLYDELFASEDFDCEWQPGGLLFICKSPQAHEHFAQVDALLRREFDVGAERFDGAALDALEPALLPGNAGGWLYRCDAHLRPDKLMASWKRVLQGHSVTIVEHAEATDFRTEGSQVRAARTSQGEIAGERFVLATGAWTPPLARRLGLRIPIQPGKGYSLTMPRPRLCPTYPLIFEEHRVAITPMRSGYRIGSTMEFAGYDTSLNPRRLAYLRQAAALYLHEPAGEPVQEQWFGWRPMTYDSRPIIDRSPAWANLWVAAGHNMLGISMAPATGKLLAEMLTGEQPHLDARPYQLARFG